MSGAEAQHRRLQKAVDGMVQALEREQIRKMQGKMFRCSADCCENGNASMEEVHQCIERCHSPLAKAQAAVTGELERFQNRLQRCMMDCNDKGKDAFDSGLKEPDVRLKVESCVTKCVDDHAVLIPSMTRTLKESLTSIAK
ncbi:protein FAM136A [Carcharodon carcharias]|uniref:protein FAM136A n=1 Tax=Carcharodon carcharias TaxID=13397 RepID=UPI001B7DE9C1|nr:protein FAM136A [Carcharodon carcharias]